jgi:hypothetical protein
VHLLFRCLKTLKFVFPKSPYADGLCVRALR